MLGALRRGDRADIGELGDICLFDLECDPAGQQPAEPPLEPGRGERAPAVVGDGCVVGDFGGGQKVRQCYTLQTQHYMLCCDILNPRASE
jgi:hypothetical protein